jgi:hypothetical protein
VEVIAHHANRRVTVGLGVGAGILGVAPVAPVGQDGSGDEKYHEQSRGDATKTVHGDLLHAKREHERTLPRRSGTPSTRCGGVAGDLDGDVVDAEQGRR